MRVFFVHIGSQPYLETAVKLAARNNSVVLIGDEHNTHLGNIKNVRHLNISDYQQDVNRFLKVYKHMSNGSRQFGERCFTRWLVLRNVAKQEKFNHLFHTDSDCLIYSDLSKVYDTIDQPKLALSVPERQSFYRHSACGATSYWSFDVLDKFCNYLFELYEDPFEFRKLLQKWEYHKSNSLSGGVCDMTALWHFTRTVEHTILTDILQNNFTFDHNINSSSNYKDDEYQMQSRFKDIKFVDGKPQAYNLQLNKYITFHSLHFQGDAKSLISKYGDM
jgi:hypothetical protein